MQIRVGRDTIATGGQSPLLRLLAVRRAGRKAGLLGEGAARRGPRRRAALVAALRDGSSLADLSAALGLPPSQILAAIEGDAAVDGSLARLSRARLLLLDWLLTGHALRGLDGTAAAPPPDKGFIALAQWLLDHRRERERDAAPPASRPSRRPRGAPAAEPLPPLPAAGLDEAAELEALIAATAARLDAAEARLASAPPAEAQGSTMSRSRIRS